MRILVVGGLGSSGARYCAILKYLGMEYEIYDVEHFPITKISLLGGVNEIVVDWSKFPTEYDKAIIATPTATHFAYCKKLIELGKPFVVEKPLSKDVKECEELVDIDEGLGRVVCNYKFTMLGEMKNPLIEYDYYKSGKDGLLWDCCQLLAMDKLARLKKESPIWKCSGDGIFLSYKELELSYVKMIRAWLRDSDRIWTLKDGLKMTQRVVERWGPQLPLNDLGVGNMEAHIGME